MRSTTNAPTERMSIIIEEAPDFTCIIISSLVLRMQILSETLVHLGDYLQSAFLEDLNDYNEQCHGYEHDI